MAAPSSVYQTYKTRRRKAGTPVVDVDLYVAKFLQNTTPPSGDNWGDGYFNSTDTEAQKIAKIKDIFKIDGWVQVAKGTATTPEMGFIGYCNSRSSGNGLYHKTERFSGVRVPTTAQASAELLNDAGLNRKPELEISQPLPDIEPKFANWINLTLAGRSAFYTNTEDTGISYKINSGSWVDVWLDENYSLKEKINRYLRGINSRGGGDNNISLPVTFIKGDTIYFRAISKNTEGTKYGEDVYNFIADENIFRFIAWRLESPSGDILEDAFAFCYEGEESDLASVTTTPTATDIILYYNEYFLNTETLDSGWWLLNEYPEKAFWVDSNGQVTHYNTRTMSTPYIRLCVIYAGTRDFPDMWRVGASVLDSSTGFPNTLTISTETRYYTYSDGIYTEVGTPETININLVSGEFSAEGRYIMRPSGATHSRTTTSTSGIGLTVESPYVLITL